MLNNPKLNIWSILLPVVNVCRSAGRRLTNGGLKRNRRSVVSSPLLRVLTDQLSYAVDMFSVPTLLTTEFIFCTRTRPFQAVVLFIHFTSYRFITKRNFSKQRPPARRGPSTSRPRPSLHGEAREV